MSRTRLRSRWRSSAACAVASAALLAAANTGCTAPTADGEVRHEPRRAGLATCAHGRCAQPASLSPTGFEPAAVSFVSPARGWVLGRGGRQDCAALRVTGDGGADWSVLPAQPAPLGPTSRSPNAVTGVTFADPANGFLYGPGLLATRNGGRSWARQPLPPVQSLTVGAGFAYALTRRGGTLSLWRTANGGRSWVSLPDPTRHNMPALLADNGSGHAFLATEGVFDALVGTLDYGRHWHLVLRDGGSFSGWAGLSFVTARTGFVIGFAYYSLAHLYRTDDGGRTWQALRI